MSINILAVFVVIVMIIIIAVIAWRSRQTSAKQNVRVSSEEIGPQQVYIGNLAYGVTESDLRKFFQEYGTITEIRVVKHTKTGRSKGFGFVTYQNISQASKALAANGKSLSDRKLVVRIAKARK